MENLTKKLGRIHVPDERDGNFLLRTLLPVKATERTFKYWWSNGWWGNQGNTPQCVAYSWTHWLAEGPITQNSTVNGSATIDVAKLYHDAQKVDTWAGENYDGTSVRAGAKILKDMGYISSYYWAWDIDTLINTLLTISPVVVGTEWKYDMFFPNEKGIISATGKSMGGHAYLLDGVNVKKKLIRIKNSWGRDWGNKGFAYISFDDMENLMSNYGEICLAIETLK